MSTVTNFYISAISITSDINLSLSPICLFLIYTISCVEIKSGRTFFTFSEETFDIIFRLKSDKEMGLQFCINLLSLFFFY